MKKVYVNPDNKDIIEKMCDEIHKGSSNHHLDYEQIQAASGTYEKFLRGFLKKHWKHIFYVFSLSDIKAKAYKYSYKADEVFLGIDRKGIYIKELARKDFWPQSPQPNGVFLRIKDEEERKEVVSQIKDHLFDQKFV